MNDDEQTPPADGPAAGPAETAVRSASTLYDVLGVRPQAGRETIERAWKLLARKHHPDLNPDDRQGAEERMIGINHAHQVLSDPERRRRYDLSAGLLHGPCLRCHRTVRLAERDGQIMAICPDCKHS